VWYHESTKEDGVTLARSQPRSLVETISAGYAVLNRRLGVLVLPLALDLYFWFGARVSFAPFFRLLRDWLELLTLLPWLDPRQQEQLLVQIQNTDMRAAIAWCNAIPVVVPGLLGLDSATTGPVRLLASPLHVALAVLTFNLLALVVSSIFLTALASGVHGDPYRPRRHALHMLGALLGLCGYALVLLALGVLLALPLLALLALLREFAAGLAPLVLGLALLAWLWVYIFTGFAVEAIVLSGMGPLRSIWTSIQIVRHFFLETLGLLLLTTLIIAGLNVLWATLATTGAGLLLALVGHAYVGSGLVAARQVFYRDRLAELDNRPLL
jgi:hypothetical protein